MKGMIFAAGLGTRLRPLTDNRPKALVEVGGMTMLERVICRLRDAGVTSIVINVHHFPDMVISFLSGHDFGVEVIVSDERSCLLDTGGGVLRARRWLDGEKPVIIHNADILTDFPICGMVERHQQSGAVATLLTSHRQSSRALLFDDSMTMRGWMRTDGSEILPNGLDIKALSPLAFGGVHIISPDIFPLLENYSRCHGEVFPIIPFYLSVCGLTSIKGYNPSKPYKWFDIGTPAKLESAARSLFPETKFGGEAL